MSQKPIQPPTIQTVSPSPKVGAGAVPPKGPVAPQAPIGEAKPQPTKKDK